MPAIPTPAFKKRGIGINKVKIKFLKIYPGARYAAVKRTMDWSARDIHNLTYCSAQTRTRIGLLGKPPAVKKFPSVESHLGVRASYATRRKRRYEANKCGWTQPFFRKARDRGIN